MEPLGDRRRDSRARLAPLTSYPCPFPSPAAPSCASGAGRAHVTEIDCGVSGLSRASSAEHGAAGASPRNDGTKGRARRLRRFLLVCFSLAIICLLHQFAFGRQAADRLVSSLLVAHARHAPADPQPSETGDLEPTPRAESHGEEETSDANASQPEHLRHKKKASLYRDHLERNPDRPAVALLAERSSSFMLDAVSRPAVPPFLSSATCSSSRLMAAGRDSCVPVEAIRPFFGTSLSSPLPPSEARLRMGAPAAAQSWRPPKVRLPQTSAVPSSSSSVAFSLPRRVELKPAVVMNPRAADEEFRFPAPLDGELSFADNSALLPAGEAWEDVFGGSASEGSRDDLFSIHGDVIFRSHGFNVAIKRQLQKEWEQEQRRQRILAEGGDLSLLEAAEPETVEKVHLYSPLQIALDRQCVLQGNVVKTQWTRMRVVRDAFHCFTDDELDYSAAEKSCLDNCNQPVACAGKIRDRSAATDASKLSDDILPKNWQFGYCLSSRLQTAANAVCDSPNYVFRRTETASGCVPAEALDWTKLVDGCVDDCFATVRCYGWWDSQTVQMKQLTLVDLQKIRQVIKNTCLCNETFEEGVAYAGCQSKTRSGRECQRWDQQKPHVHTERADAHNYCRNFNNEKEIWCYTTDPDVRFDYCDPLGVVERYVQPGETVDVVVSGVSLAPQVSLRLYWGGEEGNAACGKAGRFTALATFKNQAARGHILPSYAVHDGVVSALTWPNLTVSSNASGSFVVCGCAFTGFLASTWGDAEPCSSDAHFTLTLGTINVTGPVHALNTEKEMTAGEKKTFTVRGTTLKTSDTLVVVGGSASFLCVAPNFFRLQLELLRGTGDNALAVFSAGIGAGENQYLKTGFATVNKAGTEAQTMPFALQSTGHYVLCWQGMVKGRKASGIIQRIVSTGVDLSMTYRSVYAPSSDGVSQKLFSVFIHTYRYKEGFEDDALTVRIPTETPCKGAVVAQSRKINLESRSEKQMQTQMFLYKAMYLSVRNLPQSDSKYLETLQVCVQPRKDSNTVLYLGLSTISEFNSYPFHDFVMPSTLHSGTPTRTYSFTVDEYSYLGLHWGEIRSDGEMIIGDFYDFFTSPPFSKVLSFWISQSTNVVTAWGFSASDPSPTLMGTFNLSRPVDMALDTSPQHVHLYILMGEAPAALAVLDLTKPPSDLSQAKRVRVLDPSRDGMVKPSGFVLIYPGEPELSDPVVVLVDEGTGYIHVYDAEFTLHAKVNRLDGMQQPFVKPTDVYCFRKSGPKIIVMGSTWECFVIDQGLPRVVYFNVDATTKVLTLVSVYSGEGARDGVDTNLKAPASVVAHYYNGKTLIYVAEASSSYPMLLTKVDEESAIRFYAFLSHNTLGLSSVSHISLLYFSDDSSSLEKVSLATFRDAWRGPELQIVSLDTTATVPTFRYYPHEWYAVGDSHALDPSVVGLGSLKGVSSFVLGTEGAHAAYVGSVASVVPNTGVVKLEITSIQRIEVEVQVVAMGMVSQMKTSFKIRIACKDGYYFNQGMCARCPLGTYNSLNLVKADPASRWAKCKECGKSQTTVAEGSISIDQCQCQKGYHHAGDAEDAGECEPCPPGTWKDTVANTGCVGTCPTHSSTDVVGATSAEERLCKCEPGYYFVGEAVQTQECVGVEKGYYSPGGYEAARYPCPLHTTTNETDDPSFVAVSVAACKCEMGYTAAPAESLRDPESAASQLRNWLQQHPEHSELLDSQVCVPCGRGFYKDSIGSHACTACPENSFTSTSTAKSKAECELCKPGYYQTGNVDVPCAECPDGHFCVGSEPNISNTMQHAGAKTPCPVHTSTVPPNRENDHPFKCMCDPGYEFDYVDLTTLAVVCRATDVGDFKDILSNIPGDKCPAGSSTHATGNVSLQECICLPGYYFSTESGVCESCLVGFYCPGGRDSFTNDHALPIACPAETNTIGTTSATLADCVCDKGYYRFNSQVGIGDKVVCRPCPANSFKDWVGNEVCKACSENSGTEQTGANSAAQCLCSRGYYHDAKQAECVACSNPLRYCPGGEVDCQEGEEHCVNGKKPVEPQPCPNNTRITAGYDTPWSLDDCKCNRGFAYDKGSAAEGAKFCEPCSPGSYKTSVQDGPCNGLCGTASTSFPGAQTQSQCFCEEGTYFAADACHTCPKGAYCAGGLLPEAEAKLREDSSFTGITSADHVKPFAEPGYFLNKLKAELESPNDWQFTRCPVRNACLSNGVCSETMTEYLCSECRRGYTNTFSKGEICTVCPSMVWNILCLTGYYLATLLFNIVMTYMNVAAGFNRRSIHSIVIKIASNYLTCLSVLSVIDFNTIAFPSWVTDLTTTVTESVSAQSRTRLMSVDCLLRENLNLSFSDSFFYTMVFYALIPIVLPIIVTIMMSIVVSRVRVWYRKSTQKKLDLLKQTQQYGLYTLAEQLKEKYEEDRVFMIFRYIPLPGESIFRRMTKFMEDMIPIYVTVLFFVYSSTTRHMLSLLDCTYIDFGRAHKAKYFLRAAMSVECTEAFSWPYFKFFALGIGGLFVWSIGIPLSCFIVLYINRRTLNSRETRLKYGFLHNGFVKKYWYWEMVVFARKFLVIVVSSIALIRSEDMNGSRIWLASVIAIIFLIFHFVTQPFDKRSYLTLDRLENHSMGIWTLTLIVLGMMVGSGFSGNVNVALLLFMAILTCLFILEVGISLMFAYFDNVRTQQTFFTVPVLGYVFRFFARLSEKRKAREPIVIYDTESEVIQLVAAKRQSWNVFRRRRKNINLAERNYFIKVMAETLGFAVVHMKLDVIPGSFLEFALRLGLAFHRMEELSQQNRKSLQAIADGDLSQLADWSMQEQKRKDLAEASRANHKQISQRLSTFYRDMEKTLRIGDKNESAGAAAGSEERIRDLEGELVSDEELGRMKSDISAYEEDARAQEIAASEATHLKYLQNYTEDMTEEEQQETMYLFDQDMMTCGIALSELYLALLKLQLKDSSTISQQFDAFKVRKQIQSDAYADALLRRNRKLKVIREALETLMTSSGADLAQIGLKEEAYQAKKAELTALRAEVDQLNKKLTELKENPDGYKADEEVEAEEEWINEDRDEELQKLEEERAEREKEKEQREAADQDIICPSDPAEAAAWDSGSDRAAEEPQEEAAEAPPFRLLGVDAEIWDETAYTVAGGGCEPPPDEIE
ncbi:kringle domain-containing protein [Besnoitia besnoiti]|uniref:Kringle domain-containing protein n=1 Tax=Besnoitia besnoiti TaxID=94643 RepID=A0A2A9MD27_BESBE|nr:kringle domain-containing protein [Besnoitia besnoiti]PFH33290.1 kringle domain-containing protein [Besnoitia besnoiti]